MKLQVLYQIAQVTSRRTTWGEATMENAMLTVSTFAISEEFETRLRALCEAQRASQIKRYLCEHLGDPVWRATRRDVVLPSHRFMTSVKYYVHMEALGFCNK